MGAYAETSPDFFTVAHLGAEETPECERAAGGWEEGTAEERKTELPG